MSDGAGLASWSAPTPPPRGAHGRRPSTCSSRRTPPACWASPTCRCSASVAYGAGHLDMTIEAWERAYAGLPAARATGRRGRRGRARRDAPAVRHRAHGTGPRLARARGAAARGPGRDAGARVARGRPQLRADADRRPRRRPGVGAARHRGRFDVRPGGVRHRAGGRGAAPHPGRRRHARVSRCSTRPGWRRPRATSTRSRPASSTASSCARCKGLAQYDLAEEWTEAMERWSRTNAIGSLHGRCRVHRAEILRLRGSCHDAEHAGARRLRGAAAVPATRARMAADRARADPTAPGDIDGAEEALLAAHAPGGTRNPASRSCAWPRATTPRGGVDPRSARQPVARALEGAAAEHRSAAGAAARGAGRDRRRGRRHRPGSLGGRRAGAHRRPLPEQGARRRARRIAQGRVRLAEGDAAGAERSSPKRYGCGATSVRLTRRALARTGPRRCARATGSEHQAALERQAARTILDRHRGRAAADWSSGPTPPSANVFRREGDYWSVVFDGITVRVRDLKGMRYLADSSPIPGMSSTCSTSSRPNRRDGDRRRWSARDRHTRRRRRDARRSGQGGLPPAARRDRGGHRRGQRARRRRTGRTGRRRARLPRARASRAVGLGGRERRAGSASERARVGVTRAVRQAMARIGEHNPGLGKHLDRTIRTGTYCAYVPDPRAPADWTF